MLSQAEAELLERIDQTRLPRHIAVIMDGNRRWAKERRLPVLLGHRAGVKSFRRIMESCRDLGIEVLTAYAFSAENWRRAPVEVRVLMGLFERYTKRERDKLRRTGVKFQMLGRPGDLPEAVIREFRLTEEATAGNHEMILNLAVNYGSRDELISAVREVSREVAAGKLEPEEIDEKAFEKHLWTAGQPDPDLLIRSSGELRISNFLLWQMAYTEFYFTSRYWPDIDRETLFKAILAFQERERRYGGTA